MTYDLVVRIGQFVSGGHISSLGSFLDDTQTHANSSIGYSQWRSRVQWALVEQVVGGSIFNHI